MANRAARHSTGTGTTSLIVPPCRNYGPAQPYGGLAVLCHAHRHDGSLGPCRPAGEEDAAPATLWKKMRRQPRWGRACAAAGHAGEEDVPPPATRSSVTTGLRGPPSPLVERRVKIRRRRPRAALPPLIAHRCCRCAGAPPP